MPVDMLDEISKFVFTSKYARYLDEHKRRETWEEAVGRVEKMHLDKFDSLSQDMKDEIIWAFDLVREKRAAPSMRSMQFGGRAIEAKNERIYNCAVRHVDSLRSFSEIFFLLLCGCGVGIGLNEKYLGRLPDLVGPDDKNGTVLTYVVDDTIEGWADALEALLMCYFKNTPFTGRKFVPDYSRIRRKGSKLNTGGGKAPGYSGLKRSLKMIKELLDDLIEERGQTRISTVDAGDILCHASDAVLSGGVRRSALSIIFDLEDELMMKAKTGNWFEENPQRARSNNSVRLIRDEVTFEQFQEIFEHTKQWGEPGFVFADNRDMLFNPCFEVGFIPVTEDGVCGVQFCNLTTINGAKVTSKEEFYDACHAAAIIGTLQAAYTHFPYLSNVAHQLTEEEALLGVSMTAMLQNPDILLDPEIQQEGARIVVEVNKKFAKAFGINPAARTTVVKPEGTSTLAFGSMWSGIHGAHAKKMWRRIQMNKLDNVYQFFKQFNPHLCEESVWSANKTDDVVIFPIDLPDGIFKSDLSSIEHLDIILSTQKNWVLPGTTENNTKNVHHNVSCTVIVEDEMWDKVAAYLFDNREFFAAVSLLSQTGDKDYAQAPNESVINAEEVELFNNQLYLYTPIDYTLMRESSDGTSLTAEVACGAGGCEL
jgi:ribonucleoside-triphosphate reductase